MLRAVPMRHLEAVLLRRDLRPALQAMAASGQVQLAAPEVAPGPTSFDPNPTRQQIATAERLLAEAAVLTETLEIHLAENVESPPPPPRLPLPEAERCLHDIDAEVGALRRRRDELGTRRSRLEERLARVTPFRGAPWPLGPRDDDSRLYLLTGRLPASSLAAARAGVAHLALARFFPTVAGLIPALFATTSRHRDALESALRDLGFRAETLPESPGDTPASLADRLRSELDDLDREARELDVTWQNARNTLGPRLDTIRSAAETIRRFAEAEQRLARSPSLAVLSAWVPESVVPRITVELARETRGRCVTRNAQPGPDEDVPVLLTASRWFRPFQRLVEAYGLPGYRDIVPTPFLALSYLFMFGLMFGDVGHGAVLAAVGGALAIRSRLPARRELGMLLLLLGCSSLGFGGLYGSCFGIPSLTKHALWLDPVEGDPMALMALSLGWGAVLVSLGLALNVANQFARGDRLQAIFGRTGIFGLLFYWGAGLALVLAWHRAPSEPGLPFATVATLALPCLGWLVADVLVPHGEHRPGPPAPTLGRFAALTESVVHAGEAIVAFLANTVSFLRLAAYAMSHAALLGAVWLIAAEFSGPHLGRSPGGWAVVVGGNLLVILLEGTIAAVQALRLEYHEFFGRFFSGEGTPFQPFRLPSTS